MTTDTKRPVPTEGLGGAVVGVRLMIQHTVAREVFEHLATVSQEEGRPLEDVYLLIMNAALREHMRRHKEEKAAQALALAAMETHPKPGPRPGAPKTGAQRGRPRKNVLAEPAPAKPAAPAPTKSGAKKKATQKQKRKPNLN